MQAKRSEMKLRTPATCTHTVTLHLLNAYTLAYALAYTFAYTYAYTQLMAMVKLLPSSLLGDRECVVSSVLPHLVSRGDAVMCLCLKRSVLVTSDDYLT